MQQDLIWLWRPEVRSKGVIYFCCFDVQGEGFFVIDCCEEEDVLFGGILQQLTWDFYK